MKIVVITEKPFAEKAVKGIREILEKAGHEVVMIEKYKKKEDVIERIKDADGVIVRSDKIDEEIIKAGEKVKIIVRAGAGYDNIDIEACNRGKIVVMNTPGQNRNGVAELCIGMMIFGFRKGFKEGKGRELKNKTLGICGCGYVGKRVKEIAEGIGMKIKVYDPFITTENQVKKIEELFEESQVISLHLPLTKETKGKIGYELIKRIPYGGMICNTARKEIIDEEGLIRIMREREDLIYVTDVAPTSKVFNDEFKGRFFATPIKIGAETEESNINAGIAAATQICEFFTNGTVKFQVNKF
ncbi:hypothetical protein ENUP19_0001G0020 [Entamoeba nuttalli]|uniref:D-3-phosphoglycerate dehydrogenase n=1 Tax=Entamoeba nuttalli TaxID=412467 RepID=A0ABQ0D728_9EUKA